MADAPERIWAIPMFNGDGWGPQPDLGVDWTTGLWDADPDGSEFDTEYIRVDLAEALVDALSSIARNTCCDGCQEAALVARAAMSAWEKARGAAK